MIWYWLADGKKQPLDTMKLKDNLYECSYSPKLEGPYQLEIKYGEDKVGKSPYQVKTVLFLYLKCLINPFRLFALIFIQKSYPKGFLKMF